MPQFLYSHPETGERERGPGTRGCEAESNESIPGMRRCEQAETRAETRARKITDTRTCREVETRAKTRRYMVARIDRSGSGDAKMREQEMRTCEHADTCVDEDADLHKNAEMRLVPEERCGLAHKASVCTRSVKAKHVCASTATTYTTSASTIYYLSYFPLLLLIILLHYTLHPLP